MHNRSVITVKDGSVERETSLSVAFFPDIKTLKGLSHGFLSQFLAMYKITFEMKKISKYEFRIEQHQR